VHQAGLRTAFSYPEIPDHLYEFYQKLGFVIVEVIPDANGSGRHLDGKTPRL
jgi:hypothetical protein